MLKQAIQIAKGDDVEKVGMSLKIPVTLKEQLVNLADRNDVSTNALICSILQLTLNDDGITIGSISGGSLVPELERLEERKAKILRHIKSIGGLDTSDENEASIADELESIEETITTLKGVLI